MMLNLLSKIVITHSMVNVMKIYLHMQLKVENYDSRRERLLILIIPAILLHTDPGQDLLSI